VSSLLFYTKGSFVKVSKNLATDLKIILLDHQNNYLEASMFKHQ